MTLTLPTALSLAPTAMVKVAGAIGKSTQVMSEMMTMMKIPDLQKTMMEMSRGGRRLGVCARDTTPTFWPLWRQRILVETLYNMIVFRWKLAGPSDRGHIIRYQPAFYVVPADSRRLVICL